MPLRPPSSEVLGAASLLITRMAATDALQPVRVGIPWKQGDLRDPDCLCLRAPEGTSHPLQTEVLARWADGSVRWLLLDFLLPGGAPGEERWQLTQDEGRIPSPAVRIEDSAERLQVTIGNGAYSWRVGQGVIPTVVWGGREPFQANLAALALVPVVPPGIQARPLVATLERWTVETQGLIRTTVRLEGSFPGKRRCRFVGRWTLVAGTGLASLSVTIHNPRRARHKGGLWDLGDPNSYQLQSWSLDLPFQQTWATTVALAPESGQAPQGLPSGEFLLFQGSSAGPNPGARTHVDATNTPATSEDGYILESPDCRREGCRASPILHLSGSEGSIALAWPEFWERFPSACTAVKGLVTAWFHPQRFGHPLELQGGEQTTRTLWLHWGDPSDLATQPLSWVHSPACVRPDPAYVRASGALAGVAIVAEDPSTPCRELTQAILEGEHNWFARRDLIDEYGWRNFGEVYADHENLHSTAPKPVISHYNNQYDVLWGLLMQYLGNGDPRWYALLDPLARHILDIDLYRTEEDKAAYNGGLFWHTDHYRTAHTATHRSYSRHNAPTKGSPYGGGPGNEHNYTTGLLHYYYVTGHSEAREAVLLLARWVIAMDDGRKTPFRFIDSGPTGLATRTYEGGFHGPGRGAGNSINALLDAWLLTGESLYLDKAEALIRRTIHPADDIARHDLLNIEARWSYTVFLSILDRYLRLKAEANQRDQAWAYAKDSLLHYAAWMAEHERPYFDRKDELEFPTETWAAQELRKGNVLRLAARYAEEPLKSRLKERGEALAHRAWSDLLNFASRYSTRALALVLREGPVDAWLRQQPEGESVSQERFEFGQPEAFLSQRERVKRTLRSPKGMIKALLGALDTKRWRSTH